MPVDSNNDSNPSSIDIHSNQGDTIGVGINGSGNIIGKDISVVINEFSQDCGLTLLAPNHFKDNTNTDENFSQWLDKGYPLSLESVYQGRELKRDRILNEIRDTLEEKRRLLIVGESGTSKSTLLNEVICEYFDKGYKILYNTAGYNLKNSNTIIEKIIGLALAGNRVLVVVDNVHTTHVSLIFHVVKNLNSLNEEIRKNIRFLLAARLPEYTWAMERNLFGDASLVQTIKSLFGNDEFKLIVKYFDIEEVRAFVKKYNVYINPILKNKSLEQITEVIFDDSRNGNPILVRFAAFNKGLTSHVEQMYLEHLLDKNNNNYPHIQKVKTMILNSLFDISSLSLTDEILDESVLLSIARKELADTIIRKNGNFWETVHPKWDMELFRYMLSLKTSLYDIMNSFKEVINTIINTQIIDNFSKLSIINTIYYTLVKEKVIDLVTIEKWIKMEEIENKLDDISRVTFYTNIVGLSYNYSGRDKEAITIYDKALNINPNYEGTYNNKGISLFTLGKYVEAIVEYDNAIRINPDYEGTYNNKGNSLRSLGKYVEAIVEYDNAIRINPDYVKAYFNKGISLSSLGKYENAIVEYDNAIRINPDYGDAYNNKGSSLSSLGKYVEAIVEYDNAIRINPDYGDAYNNKGSSLSSLGKYVEAIVEYDNAIRINPDYGDAYNNKGSSLSSLGKYVEAIVEYDNAIRINPDYGDAYNNKGISLSSLGKYVEAIVEYDNAIRINPDYGDAYNNKGSSLSSLGKYVEAIVEYDNAIRINPDYGDAYNNKGSSLSSLGKYVEAIVEYDNAIRINPDYVKAYFNKGNSLHSLGRYENAIVEYDNAIRINPDYVKAYNNKGNSLRSLGRYENAIVEYDKALEIDSNYVITLLGKSVSLFLLGKKNEAKQVVNKALEIEPDNQFAQQIKEGFEK